MYGYTLLFVCIYVYIWACVFVYTSVYVFICMAVFGYMYICFGLPVCAHAWLFAIGVLQGFPRLRFYFFDLDVLSLTLVIWEWMLQAVMSSGGVLIVARVQCSVWTKPFLGPLGLCLGVLWVLFSTCLELACLLLWGCLVLTQNIWESLPFFFCKAVLCIVL